MKTDWLYLYIIVLLALAFWLGFQIGLASIEYSQFCVNYIPNRQNSQNTTLIAPVSAYTLSAEVTAYSEIDSCHYENCLMASGNKAYIGAIACPRYLPLYTRVVIDDNPYICEDRVSKQYPNRFDIFMGYGKESYEKAIHFGNQKKQVQIYPV